MLAADGVGGFTARNVAARAQTSPPAVYELFSDKAGLVREVFFEGFRLLGDRFGRLKESEDPRADLIRMVGTFRVFVRENPMLAQVMFSRPFADFDPSPGDLAAGFQNVFTVVENEQPPAIRHRLGDSIKASRRPGPPDPDPLHQGGNYLLLGTAWHQIDVARPLRPPSRYLGPCRLNRQRGLADSPDAGQRHHRVSAKPGGHLREVCGSPDKGGPPRWQPHRTVPAGITVTAVELAGNIRHQPTLTPWSEASQASRTPPAAGSAQVVATTTGTAGPAPTGSIDVREPMSEYESTAAVAAPGGIRAEPC